MAYILSVRSTHWLAHFIVCVCVWSSCKYGHSTPVRRSEHMYCLYRYVRVCILLLSDMSICRVCHSLSFVCVYERIRSVHWLVYVVVLVEISLTSSAGDR